MTTEEILGIIFAVGFVGFVIWRITRKSDSGSGKNPGTGLDRPNYPTQEK